MSEKMYPWGGKFIEGNPHSPVAVVTLSEEMDFPKDMVALYGNMKTENLGVEKVVANVVSNPNIRYVLLVGNDVKGHRSGDSLIKLYKNGIDSNNRVIDAKSAIPFIENLPQTAIERFQKQVKVIDLIGETDTEKIKVKIIDLQSMDPGIYGEPMYVEQVSHERVIDVIHSDFALHSSIDVDLYGFVTPLGGVQ